MARVAFMGTGIMGGEMARRLLAAGHELRVYNRTAAKARELVAHGARLAESPAAAAEGAGFIISMVGDDNASRRVWLGPDGVLAARLEADAVAIESATLSRRWVLELAAAVEGAGLGFIDCPVTGGPDGARAGALTLLVGADPKTLDAARGVLSAYASKIIRFGAPGAGTAYKLMVNLMGAAQAVALAEGLLLAERVGLDPALTGEALAKGAVASPLLEYLIERMVGGNHDEVYFSARWRHKDAAYALELACEVGQEMAISAAAAEVFAQATQQGLGERNSSVVIETLRGAPGPKDG
jgi:3-hydroxyisobutyrate dehydrogenase